jgi:starch synthase (maltosyl-transferring)
MAALGLAEDEEFVAHDVLSGQTFAWGANPFVRLDPHGSAAHVVVIEQR